MVSLIRIIEGNTLFETELAANNEVEELKVEGYIPIQVTYSYEPELKKHILTMLFYVTAVL